nr:hypothetical protein [Lysobacter enzymogenes]
MAVRGRFGGVLGLGVGRGRGSCALSARFRRRGRGLDPRRVVGEFLRRLLFALALARRLRLRLAGEALAPRRCQARLAPAGTSMKRTVAPCSTAQRIACHSGENSA